MGTSVPLPRSLRNGQSAPVINGVIIHLHNDMPVLVDLEELPEPGDRLVRCTNVRLVDGKRPAFVHEKGSTFIFPVAVIRLIEVPRMSDGSAVAMQDDYEPTASGQTAPLIDEVDEEAEEDLLARIRQI
jgi:hypothetical protein